MTYRERREAKATRLTEWAEKREVKAAAAFAVGEQYRGDTAFNTQPGHIPERARVIRAAERGFTHMEKAREMTSRAAGIASQLDRSIYSDDPDAIDALTERIATLETQRDNKKAKNAAFRKTHAVALKTLTPYMRDIAMPHQGFELTNLSADIRRNVKRLENIRARSG